MRYFEFKKLPEQNVPTPGVQNPLGSASGAVATKGPGQQATPPSSPEDNTGVTNKVIGKPEIIQALRELGYENVKVDGNKLKVFAQIPDKAKKSDFRTAIMKEILSGMQQKFSDYNPRHIKAGKFGSQGGIVFDGTPVAILVKDEGGQGEKSAGVGNEIELASMLQSLIEKYKTVNVTFVDPRGKKLSMKNCDQVIISGRDVSGRKKADVVLKSKQGELPISIKKVNADMWESADRLFGQRAKEIIKKLQDDGVIKLKNLIDDQGRRYYRLDKEIVIEPTEEEAMQAIFGSDLNPRGGVVIQTFKPEHYIQNGNNVTVECYTVITNKEDIPESHLMVWQIRNNVERNNPLPGLRTLGVTLTRGIGKSGKKDVVLVDQHGNVVKNPNL
jgi:hypothetical protein